MIRNCNGCGSEYQAEVRYLNRGQGLFCSISCSSSRKLNKSHNCVCAYCGNSFYRSPSKQKCSKSGLLFCNRKCKEAAQSLRGGFSQIQPSHYGKGLVPDYSYARKEHCENCGYNAFPQILCVHHLDKDRANNSEDNLICLCPNCHDEWHLKDRSGRFHKMK